jgi:signal transduction histidine kinase/DNA-binding response OmpR family regulator
MTFGLNSRMIWVIVAFVSGAPCHLFAQTTSADQNTGSLWYSVESLLGQPNDEAARYFKLDKTPSAALLAQAEAYIVSFKNDSAVQVSNLLFHTLRRENQLDSPFGLKVQLVLARALEHSDADSIALRLLLHVRESSQHEKLWDTYVESCLALALVEEFKDHPAQCLEYLNQARTAIGRYHQDDLYPAYAVRACSYYRLIVINRDSAIFYAREILRTAPAQNMFFEEAWGHMLLSWLLYGRKDAEFLEHHRKAAALFLKIEHYTGLSYTYREIGSHYAHSGDLNTALLYNDSSRVAAQKSIATGNKWNLELFRSYKTRADLFRQLERHDSAWYYLNKGSEEELKLTKAKESARVAEIDARYFNQTKTRQIQEQTESIHTQQKAKNLLLLTLALMLLLAIGLTWGLVRYRKEQRILSEKNHLIEQQTEQLRSLDVAKSRFFANISHELRTPLTLLTSPVQTLLKENQLTERQTHLLQMAERSGKQLGQLINEILDLRKLEMGKMTVTAEPTELRAWFQPYLAQFESLAGQKNITYDIVLDLPERVAAMLDREKCRQILFNLLSNAFKFTPQQGRIEVSLRVAGQQMLLLVTNSGSGIHPDDLPQVFDRYFQSNRPEKPVDGGTGIGLALCREYAQLLGGTIGVESTPGTDTVFRVTLPLQLTEIEAESDAPDALPMPNGVRETTSTMPITATNNKLSTILLVEDNPDLRDYIRVVLQDNYQVVTAEHGQAALDLMHKNSPNSASFTPDLILSDLMMPVMDGYQLLERLKSDPATQQIPVVMLTARAEAQDKLKALRIGVDDYLTKPFDEEELLARIENLLKNQAARRLATTEETTDTDTPPLLSQPDREWLETFEAYVQKHFASDLLSVSSLAYQFAMSESTLLRQLKRLTGLSPQQYIQEVRLNEARHMLEIRRYSSIAQVAAKVGYDDTRTFSRSFKQRFGKLPSELMEA